MRTGLLLAVCVSLVSCTGGSGTTTSGSSSSSGASGSSSGSSSSSGGPSSSGGSSGSSGTLTGMLGGKSFTFVSGFAHQSAGGSVDIVLGDVPGLCDSVKAERFKAGTTIVQAYGLSGSVPGPFVSTNDDMKYATLSATCASGAPVEANVENASRAVTAKTTISLSKLDTEVAGEMTMEFEDGSKVSGSFVVPICSESEAENATCE